jgi:Uma2 family endonuclease
MENEVKEPAPKYNYVSQETYLEMERASLEKHEYYNGEVFAMAGASKEHNLIASNLNRLAAELLHRKGCRLFGSDFRVHIPENTLYTYPDFTIVCEEAETSDSHKDNLLNPAMIIEIVSKYSRDYDRGAKFHFYRSIKSLQEYILIDSLEVCIEVYIRQPDNSWLLKEYNQLEETFSISKGEINLRLADIYEDVHFEE